MVSLPGEPRILSLPAPPSRKLVSVSRIFRIVAPILAFVQQRRFLLAIEVSFPVPPTSVSSPLPPWTIIVPSVGVDDVVAVATIDVSFPLAVTIVSSPAIAVDHRRDGDAGRVQDDGVVAAGSVDDDLRYAIEGLHVRVFDVP